MVGSGIELKLGVQTNGLLFDRAIGDLFLEKNVNIGVSLDGPPTINDRFRVDKKGAGTTAELERRLAVLVGEYSSLFRGFLSVIHLDADPVDVLDYLSGFKPPGVDLLLPLDHHDRPPLGKRAGNESTPYADWLIDAFDHWLAMGSTLRIRWFEAIMKALIGLPSGVESVGLSPVDLVVIQTDGSLEAVDSLKSTFNGAVCLGYDVFRHDLDIVSQDIAVTSRQAGAAALHEQCQSCPVLHVCGGGYLPHRYSSARGFDNPSVYCRDLEKLIRHVGGHLSAALHAADAGSRPAGIGKPASNREGLVHVN